ncbi:MAG TPA: Fe-Mn family superoxide dismutase [Burkholderiaceae bacterium]|nr:Fe-Mn family superoxide dismutase [Burkholderiaceae bacterium]
MTENSFWNNLAKDGSTRRLVAAINRDFGSFAQMEARFVSAVDELTAGGSVWLAAGQTDGKLHVLSTTPHLSVSMQGYDPLLERHLDPPIRPWTDGHARAAALKAWLSAVDWNRVARRYEHANQLHAGRAAATSGSA